MRVLIMTAIAVALAGPAAAQTGQSAFDSTVSGVAGGGKTWDDEGQIGSGVMVGGRVDRRLFGNTFLEGGLEVLGHSRTGRFEAEGHTTFISGTLIQRFGHRAAQPYVLGGYAVALHSGTAGFPEDGLVSDTDGTSHGILFGGGLAAAIGDRFEIGPETRFFMLTSDDDSLPAWAMWVGVRFGVRF